MRVHWLGAPEPAAVARVEAALEPSVRLRVGRQLDAPVDVVVGGRPGEALSWCRRALVVPYAGLPEDTRDRLRDRPDLEVYNLHHNAASVAEMAVALLLAAGKCVLPMDRALRGHDWRPRYAPDPGLSLHGEVAVVLGFGAIGRRVGAVLTAMGMSVVGVRRRPGPGEHGPASLAAWLPRARVLVVCVPLTDATRGLIGAAALAALPDGAVVVNVGRAAVVDEDALFDALASGRLSAGLDVWYRYPEAVKDRASTPPANRPFETLDNVVLSPHRAGHGQAIEARREAELCAVLNGLARGDVIGSRVDVDAGY